MTTTVDNPEPDLITGIDDVTGGGSGGRKRVNDVDPGSLEGRLKLLFPGHTFWHREVSFAEKLNKLVDRIGAQLIGGPPDDEQSGPVRAVWSTPDGLWIIDFQRCTGDHTAPASEQELYNLVIDGPGMDISKDHVTVDQVIELLTVVGAVRP